MSHYIDTGLIPSDIAQQIPQVYCTGCGKRISALSRTFEELTKGPEGLSNEEAMDKLKINRWCCRTKFVTPHIVPTASTKYDPEAVQGKIRPSVSEYPQSYKWHGNMAVVRDSQQKREVEAGETFETKTPPMPKIPDGYYFIRWLMIPNSYDGKQTPLYTAQIGLGKGPKGK